MCAQPHNLILGSNFAGLTTARYIREFAGENARMTCIDRKPYLTFIPNIPIEIWNNNNPVASLHMPFIKFLDRHNIDFNQRWAYRSFQGNGAVALYKPAGGVSGRTAPAVVIWLIGWEILHCRWKDRHITYQRTLLLSMILIGGSIVLTFPLLWNLF